jgi:hypothetical protein
MASAYHSNYRKSVTKMTKVQASLGKKCETLLKKIITIAKKGWQSGLSHRAPA